MCSTPIRTTSISATAERFDVTPKTVRRWIAEGRLTAYRVGPRLIRLDKDEVDALLTPIPVAN